VLSAHGKSAWERLEKTVLLGELALDGRVRPVKRCAVGRAGRQTRGMARCRGFCRQPRRGQPRRRYRGVGCADVAPTPILARRKGTTGRPDRHPIVGAGAVGRPRRCDRPVSCPLRGRGRRRRRPPLDADRPARSGQNDAGPTASGLASPAVAQRVAGGDGHSFGGRSAVGQHPADHPATVRGAASHVERGVAGRRRHRDVPAGRGQPSAPGECCSSTSAPRSA
jgi:hypothetical protein